MIELSRMLLRLSDSSCLSSVRSWLRRSVRLMAFYDRTKSTLLKSQSNHPMKKNRFKSKNSRKSLKRKKKRNENSRKRLNESELKKNKRELNKNRSKRKKKKRSKKRRKNDND